MKIVANSSILYPSVLHLGFIKLATSGPVTAGRLSSPIRNKKDRGWLEISVHILGLHFTINVRVSSYRSPSRLPGFYQE